jgi:hypothetical protein
VVEGARLESVYRSKAYRGFESRPLRNKCMIENPDFRIFSFQSLQEPRRSLE